MVQLAPFTVLVANLVMGGALAATATASPLMRNWSRLSLALVGALVALLPLLDALLLGLYVFGEDSYRDNGISRWDAYRSPSGGALGPTFVLSVVWMIAASALLAVAGVRGRERLLGAARLRPLSSPSS